MEEEWREVPGFPGYAVSDQGQVRGRTGGVLKPHSDATGRQRVDLGGKRHRRAARVHTLVLEAFQGPRPEGHEASHLNGDASDNRAANLAWESHADNVARKRDHGTHVQGERSPLARLTEAQVREIRRRCASGETQRTVAEDHGVTQTNVSAIVTRKSWGHVDA